MSRSNRKSQNDGGGSVRAGGPGGPRGRTGRGGAGERRTWSPAAWFFGKGPVFRFVVGFSVLVGGFAVFFFAYFTRTAAFDSYLNLNADVSAWLLRLLGDDARSSGCSVISSRASVQIRHGCDAIFPAALFVGAVLASPVGFASKIPGLFIGSVVLLSINLVRIISLYYTRIFAPDYFHMMHIDVWQPLFIFLSLLFWVLWALRATRPRDATRGLG